MGFHNHMFCPEGGTGQTMCLWETKSDCTKDEFQSFIDSEKAPGGGQTFDNEVHKVAAGGMVPSAFFQKEEQEEEEQEQVASTQQRLLEQTVSVRELLQTKTMEFQAHANGNPCLSYCRAAEAETEFVVN